MTENRDNVLRGSNWIATAAAIAAGTSSYADVVRFENPDGEPGSFYWPFNVLDVTDEAGAQPGTIGGPSSSFQDYFGDFYPTFSYATTFQTGGGLEIFSQGFSNRYAAPLDTGSIVGPDLEATGAFTSGTTFEFSFDACDVTYYYVGYPCYCYYGPYYDCTSGERGILPEGVETYLGVRFDLGKGTQYGWIKVIRNWVEIDALAWGFETDPGVPIRVGATPCITDIDGDGNTGFQDLVSLLAAWGTDGPGADIAAPFDTIDFTDLVGLLSAWGFCTSPLGDAGDLGGNDLGGNPAPGSLAALAFGAPVGG